MFAHNVPQMYSHSYHEDSEDFASGTLATAHHPHNNSNYIARVFAYLYIYIYLDNWLPDASNLDTWVFDRVEELFASSHKNRTLNDQVTTHFDARTGTSEGEP
jgi:hypothetical protein